MKWTEEDDKRLIYLRLELRCTLYACAKRMKRSHNTIRKHANRLQISKSEGLSKHTYEAVCKYEAELTPHQVLKQTYGDLIEIRGSTYYFKGKPRNFNDIMRLLNKYRHSIGAEQVLNKEEWRYIP